jgi:2-polyprenyl-6-methoxyphenol hydroxylase-like FAD-dependent oxidoreductase
MEHFRRWGIADRIRAAAPVPVSWSQRVVAATSLLGPELTRFEGAFGLSAVRTDIFAEPGQTIPQPAVEQVLRDAVRDLPDVKFALGWSLESLTESAGEVIVEAAAADGTVRHIAAQYVLGCDGGDSRTRRCLGIPMLGSSETRNNTSIVFRAPGLAGLVPHDPAVQYWIFNTRAGGAIGRFDLADTWWCGVHRLADGLPPAVDNPAMAVQELLGPNAPADLHIEILSTNIWQARMLVAETFHAGRVFLAGDSAHLNPPEGGHGFNTGVGDAVNVGWKLAATLQGWGGPRLLDSYGAERRAIAIDTIAAAGGNRSRMRSIRVTRDLDAAGPAGDRARRALGERIHYAMYQEFNSLGLVLGYEYTDSPVIAHGGTSGTGCEQDSTDYVPATRPGARLPHTWLPNGQSLYDTLGTGLTLLTFGGSDSSAMAEAARGRGVPLTIADLGGLDLGQDDQTSAMLVRPDQHIAWRGSQLSLHAADAVLDHVLGVNPSRTAARPAAVT